MALQMGNAHAFDVAQFAILDVMQIVVASEKGGHAIAACLVLEMDGGAIVPVLAVLREIFIHASPQIKRTGTTGPSYPSVPITHASAAVGSLAGVSAASPKAFCFSAMRADLPVRPRR